MEPTFHINKETNRQCSILTLLKNQADEERTSKLNPAFFPALPLPNRHSLETAQAA